jgi:putative two-component system hydrogenase maturation factor HypX/HoxX
LESGDKGIKLPATFVLKDVLPKASSSTSALKNLFAKNIQVIDIDYKLPGRQLPCQEVWYEQDEHIAYLYFPVHNGGMSTEQCRLLLSVYQHVATLPVKAIVLIGGEESWSNGIHLNHIEAAESPADESWLNINAIDNLVYQIITTLDKVTIAAVAGSAGAGGAILALAADKVFVREGVIFNPHYKNMGELYGSEYWTYLLPKRVGQELAATLTDQRLPVSAKKAWHIGMIDKVLDKKHSIFTAQIKHLVQAAVADDEILQKCLDNKAKNRCHDEAMKPLAAYRTFELTQMYANFYGNDAYHQARRNFVYKINADTQTPENIALHRRQSGLIAKLSRGSLYHFVWQDIYQTGDDVMDKQHKDVFLLAENLLSSASKTELADNIQLLYQHVKEHFDEEEELMAESGFQNIKGHTREHHSMLEKLQELDRKITEGETMQTDIQDFMDKWSKHIIHSDQLLNIFLNKRAFEQIP